ncbi:hypothetical protein Plhal304r1_c017g0061471 [Plasmopara halstedii]
MYKCDIHTKHEIEVLIGKLLTQPVTLNLAFRLHAMRSNHILDLSVRIHDDLDRYDILFGYAAFVRFNFIEHEIKRSEVVLPDFIGFMSNGINLDVKKIERLFSDERWTHKDEFIRLGLVDTNIFNNLDKDEVRLFKAAVQSRYQAKLVKEALEAISNGVSLARDFNMEVTFKAMLKDEELVRQLQAVLKDERAMQSLQAMLKDGPLLPPKGVVEMKEEKVDDATKLISLIKKEDTLQLLEMFMADNEHVKILKDAVVRFTAVDDMLSSTELDTVTILQAILDDPIKVQILENALKDEAHLSLFKKVLEDKEKIHKFRVELPDKTQQDALDQVFEDMNQVFSLRVALIDDGRLELLRAAVNDNEKVMDVVDFLKKKKLVNIFRSLLDSKKKINWLGAATSTHYKQVQHALQRRDRRMFAMELFNHLESLEKTKGIEP